MTEKEKRKMHWTTPVLITVVIALAFLVVIEISPIDRIRFFIEPSETEQPRIVFFSGTLTQVQQSYHAWLDLYPYARILKTEFVPAASQFVLAVWYV